MNVSQPNQAPARWSLPGLTLFDRVGVGGHAEVWRARHDRSRAQVAVKLLSRAASSEEAALVFQTELLAIAQLRHPHVIRLLDYEIDCPDAPPFVVMEWAEGTLHRARPRTFEGLTRWLEAILSALAHAHASGVVHCDVKPRNVLLVEGRPKLADFGIARLREAGPSVRPDKVWGTPAYAAPELFAAPWCVGPWTDLYAVGITAFELATGVLPFGDGTDAIRGHTAEPLPELVPRFPMPAGFPEWLSTLCAKEPASRFQRAAEAHAALLRLKGGVRTPTVRVTRTPRGPIDRSSTLPLFEERTPAFVAPRGHLLAPARVPLPVPATWRDPGEAAAPAHPAESETVLLVRAAPLVGRDAARDVLWAELGEAAETRSGRLVLVRGPAGVGKSHLAQDVARRAHQSGAANVLVARFGTGGPESGLRGMWLRYLGHDGRDVGALQHLVQAAFAGDEIEAVDRFALSRFVAAESEPPGGTSDAHALACRLLRACATRPLWLWLDDIHADPAALELISTLVRDPLWSHTPIVVVATLREDGWATDDDDERRVRVERALAELRPIARDLPLGELERSSMNVLLRGPLGLDEHTAERLAERAGGSPLLAVQLVTEWVQRGFLVRDTDGRRVAPDGLRVPGRIATFFRERVESLLQRLPEHARVGLELAATLGLEVDLREFALACRWTRSELELRVVLGAQPGPVGSSQRGAPTLGELPHAVISELIAHGLLGPSGGGFRFVHSLLREALVARAEESRRASWLHQACAAALREAYPPRAPGAAERRARHLREAGFSAEAIDAYVLAVEVAARREDDGRVEELLREARSLLDGLDDPGPATTRLSVARLDALLHMGRYAEAREVCATIDEARCGPVDRVRWLCAAGRLARARVREDALAPLDEALGLALSLEDEALIARCHLELGRALDLQQRDEARPHLEAARRLHRALGDAWGEARSLINLADHCIDRGELDVDEWFGAAEVLYESVGSRAGVALVANGRGRAATRRGDRAAARAHYSRGLLISTRPHQRLVLEANAASLDLDDEHYLAALAGFLRCWETAAREQVKTVLGQIHLDLAACHAGLDDWPGCAAQLRRAEDELVATGLAGSELAHRAEWIGERAAGRFRWAEARSAWELAVGQFRSVSADADRARVEARLDACRADRARSGAAS